MCLSSDRRRLKTGAEGWKATVRDRCPKPVYLWGERVAAVTGEVAKPVCYFEGLQMIVVAIEFCATEIPQLGHKIESSFIFVESIIFSKHNVI